MASIFVPGAAGGSAKPNNYCGYVAYFRRHLMARLKRSALDPRRLGRYAFAPSPAPSARDAVASFHVVALSLGGGLAARTGACAHGSYGKLHALWAGGELGALKVMRTTAAAGSGKTTPVTLAEARRETALLAKYACPGAQLFLDRQTQRLGLRMELALGTIGAALGDGPSPSLRALHGACLMEQVSGQLAEMHRDQVWHLDLKPDNILVFRDGRIRACDMGKACFADEQMGWGTIAYLSPEAMLMPEQAAMAGDMQDIWSLGLSVLEMLVPDAKGLFDLVHGFSIYGQLRAYLNWYQDLTRGAPLDLENLRLDTSGSPFTAIFLQALEVSPKIGEILLRHLLVPLSQRATAAEVLALCRQILADGIMDRWRAHLASWEAPRAFREVHTAALGLRLDHESRHAAAARRPDPAAAAALAPAPALARAAAAPSD